MRLQHSAKYICVVISYMSVSSTNQSRTSEQGNYSPVTSNTELRTQQMLQMARKNEYLDRICPITERLKKALYKPVNFVTDKNVAFIVEWIPDNIYC